MISTMPKKNHLVLKLLCVGLAIYAFKNKEEVKHGLKDFFAKNQVIQEAKSSLKWAYDEFGPQTEAEKAQSKAYAEEQHRRREEYRAMGINPQIEYVSKEDGEKWNQAVKEWHEIKKQMGHDR